MLNKIEDLPLRTLLVVEDEVELLNVIREHLELEGMQVLCAKSVPEAKEFLQDPALVTAILSDISMPGETGLELLRWVRAKGWETPVVFVTAHDTKDNMKEAIQLGALDFIEKPFDHEHLVKTTERALEVGIRFQAVNRAQLSASELQKNSAMINRLRLMGVKKS